MGYGRLGSSKRTESSFGESFRSQLEEPTSISSSKKGNRKLIILGVVSFVFLVAAAASAGLVVILRPKTAGERALGIRGKPSQAISKTCSKTRYPDLCVNSLVDFPGALQAGERDLVHISVNMTLRRVGKALYDVSDIGNLQMDTLVRSAYGDCMELLEDSVEHLSRSLASVVPPTDGTGQTGTVGSTQDVMTWLSAALTNQDTCVEGFDVVNGGNVKNQIQERLKDLSELVSNCLAIFAFSGDDGDFSGVPIQNRRRLMGSEFPAVEESHGFPEWLTRRERRLLQMPVDVMRADIVVSKDGNGTFKKISDAIKAAPEHSSRRFIIYVKAGRYEEKNLKVGRRKTNLMFMGDGKGKTVITGGKSVFDNFTTFHTASFAATGAGFIARDITFENYAGPEKHQAVALRIGADHSVVYRCNVIGYQDTLYVHSQRQFYRECDVYGTVDFIFGNAAVVLQNCSLYARKPMDQQKNTITAQNRKDPNQNTGISIHECRILAAQDLESVKVTYQTYLGRPWKLYSRTVYMLSYMEDHIHPRGWLEWNATFALDTLYYGEYMNYGPGGAVGQRVGWPGYRVITQAAEAAKFTVAQFIYGSSWLPATGVAFVAGLSV
ncbi:probable pectinesterase/pectinesterase inhibitor 34 [Telopea speciosissima]|uniref:probable pectinesterase/pectinesterase inhibitor 34 n=1 Tax=Telopea speciosissima TaxID=54955 RepID=UPI001CC55847|nr:probable pectinesterase/pectinesterase inhibitor 34 [Telopea speciosissima]XP_043706786.1 probable pectinesterase/pectinesterase inhibitor 34 [Telopea speciosissima]